MVRFVHRFCFLCHATSSATMVHNGRMHFRLESCDFGLSADFLLWQVRGKAHGLSGNIAKLFSKLSSFQRVLIILNNRLD